MSLKYKPVVIALDLEGTLISNAVSQFPRPGLYSFLEYCDLNFSRIVIFTAVKELHFRQIANTLIELEKAPDWFVNLEYINWQGKYKDLSFIPNTKPEQIILIDDRPEYIKPAQKHLWLPIPEYEYPYPQNDRELSKAIANLSYLC